MIFWIVAIVLIVLCVMFPVIRCIILHPFKTVFYACKDLIVYFRHKEYNRCESGFIDVYCGLFGQGKTLSAVRRVCSDYKRYNNKLLWVDGKFQRVKINILSNVELQGVPFIKLESMQQIVDWTAIAPDHRNEFTLVLIDEASAILNSRDFKNNLDFFSINAFVTCRHYNLGLILTSQRFLLIDKLAREVSQRVIQCNKFWRIIIHSVYDAYELENVLNPMNVKPKAIHTLFCGDSVFGHYNTLAVVGAIKKACIDGAMRSEQEIRDSIGISDPMDNSSPEPKKFSLFRRRK